MIDRQEFLAQYAAGNNLSKSKQTTGAVGHKAASSDNKGKNLPSPVEHTSPADSTLVERSPEHGNSPSKVCMQMTTRTMLTVSCEPGIQAERNTEELGKAMAQEKRAKLRIAQQAERERAAREKVCIKQ